MGTGDSKLESGSSPSAEAVSAVTCGCIRGVTSSYNSESSASETSHLVGSDSASPPVVITQPAHHHAFVGGSPHANTGLQIVTQEEEDAVRNGYKRPNTGPFKRKENEDGYATGGEDRSVNSGIISPREPDSHRSPLRGGSRIRSQSTQSSSSYVQRSQPLLGLVTDRGKELMASLKNAYKWRDAYSQPTQEFLTLMDRLFMECQVHLTELSSRDSTDSRKEADAMVQEMIALRNHWGTQLLPPSVCNAFVRERIFITIGLQQYRIDCAEFFEPAPFYFSQAQNVGDLMKLYRFSVYDLSRNEVILRYYLERSNVIQLYHVLCYAHGNQRGQVHPFGTECPSFWELRKYMMNDVCHRLQTGHSKGNS